MTEILICGEIRMIEKQNGSGIPICSRGAVVKLPSHGALLLRKQGVFSVLGMGGVSLEVEFFLLG